MLLISLISITLGCTRLILQYEFDNDTDWETEQSEHFMYHYRSTSSTGNDIERVIGLCEGMYASVVDTLGVDFNEIINIYIYKYGESKFALHDYREGKSIDPVSMSIYTVDTGTNLAQYEIAQIITKRVIGPAGTEMMNNGLAVALSNNYMNISISAWMRFVANNRKEIDINELLYDADKYKNVKVDDRISKAYRLSNSNVDFYTAQTGCFARYLLDKTGIDMTVEFYETEASEFIVKLESVLGMTIQQINFEYSQFLHMQYDN